MYNYPNASDVPWNSYKSSIKRVVIEGDVQSIGNSAFKECRSLSAGETTAFLAAVLPVDFQWSTAKAIVVLFLHVIYNNSISFIFH